MTNPIIVAAEMLEASAAELEASHTRAAGDWSGEAEAQAQHDLERSTAAALRAIALENEQLRADKQTLMREHADLVAKAVAAALASAGGAVTVHHEPLPGAKLTHKQLQIVRLADTGKSNKEIAEVLNLSIATVKTHLANVRLKLRVGNTTEAAHVLRKHGLLGEVQ